MRLTGPEPRPGSLKRDSHLARVNETHKRFKQGIFVILWVYKLCGLSNIASYTSPVSDGAHGLAAMVE